MIGQRYHAIDKLRASMILAVAFGHTMLPYVTWPRRFKDPDTSIAFDVIGVFLYSFAMDLFFLTAGFTAALLLARRGANALIRARVHRILMPFLVAWLVLAPLTRGAYKFSRAVAETGSVQAGVDILATWSWLDWSKIYHLWFLPGLIFLTFLTLALRYLALGFAPRLRERINAAARRMIASRWRVAWLALLIVVPTTAACLVPHGSAEDSYFAGLSMFIFFLLGWLLYQHRDLLDSLTNQCSLLFGISLAALPMTVWAMRIRQFEGEAMDMSVGIVAGIGNTLIVSCMTFGLLELFQSRLNQPSRAWRYVNDAAYWIFLVHFPIVIAASGLLSVTPYPAVIKYLMTVAIALPIVLLTYEFGARGSVLAPAS